LKVPALAALLASRDNASDVIGHGFTEGNLGATSVGKAAAPAPAYFPPLGESSFCMQFLLLVLRRLLTVVVGVTLLLRHAVWLAASGSLDSGPARRSCRDVPEKRSPTI